MKTFRNHIDKTDLFFRFTDGKFLLATDKVKNKNEASNYAYTILSIFKNSFLIKGHEIAVTVSIPPPCSLHYRAFRLRNGLELGNQPRPVDPSGVADDIDAG